MRLDPAGRRPFDRDRTILAEVDATVAEVRQIGRGEEGTVAETSTFVTFVASALGVALVPQGVEQVRIPGVRYLPLRPELAVPRLLARRDQAGEAVAARVAGVLARLG